MRFFLNSPLERGARRAGCVPEKKQLMKYNRPDYKRIYCDILNKKYPQKKEECQYLLQKEGDLSAIEILRLNKKIFGSSDKNILADNQKYRSYSQSDIIQILEYQKKHNLNNTQLSNHFKLSRNTVAKWRKQFLI